MNAKRKKARQKRINKTALIIILLLALTAVYSVTNNEKINYRASNSQQIKLDSDTAQKKEQETLKCARKMDQDGKELASLNCLFMGCGDFFQ